MYRETWLSLSLSLYIYIYICIERERERAIHTLLFGVLGLRAYRLFRVLGFGGFRVLRFDQMVKDPRLTRNALP